MNELAVIDRGCQLPAGLISPQLRQAVAALMVNRSPMTGGSFAFGCASNLAEQIEDPLQRAAHLIMIAINRLQTVDSLQSAVGLVEQVREVHDPADLATIRAEASRLAEHPELVDIHTILEMILFANDQTKLMANPRETKSQIPDSSPDLLRVVMDSIIEIFDGESAALAWLKTRKLYDGHTISNDDEHEPIFLTPDLLPLFLAPNDKAIATTIQFYGLEPGTRKYNFELKHLLKDRNMILDQKLDDFSIVQFCSLSMNVLIAAGDLDGAENLMGRVRALIKNEVMLKRFDELVVQIFQEISKDFHKRKYDYTQSSRSHTKQIINSQVTKWLQRIQELITPAQQDAMANVVNALAVLSPDQIPKLLQAIEKTVPPESLPEYRSDIVLAIFQRGEHEQALSLIPHIMPDPSEQDVARVDMIRILIHKKPGLDDRSAHALVGKIIFQIQTRDQNALWEEIADTPLMRRYHLYSLAA